MRVNIYSAECWARGCFDILREPDSCLPLSLLGGFFCALAAIVTALVGSNLSSSLSLLAKFLSVKVIHLSIPSRQRTSSQIYHTFISQYSLFISLSFLIKAYPSFTVDRHCLCACVCVCVVASQSVCVQNQPFIGFGNLSSIHIFQVVFYPIHSNKPYF